MRTVKERILDYMGSHKTPVTIKKLAKHYIMSESGTLRVMKELLSDDKVETIPSKPVQYRLK